MIILQENDLTNVTTTNAYQISKELINIECLGSGTVTVEFSTYGDNWATNDNVPSTSMPCSIDISDVPTHTLIRLKTSNSFTRIILNID